MICFSSNAAPCPLQPAALLFDGSGFFAGMVEGNMANHPASSALERCALSLLLAFQTPVLVSPPPTYSQISVVVFSMEPYPVPPDLAVCWWRGDPYLCLQCEQIMLKFNEGMKCLWDAAREEGGYWATKDLGGVEWDRRTCTILWR